MRIGVVSNPRSLRNRKGGLAGHCAGNGDVPHAQPRTQQELAEALSDFRRREVGVIAVSGGDGTIREVLTALPQAYGESLPDLALLPAGRTNLLARALHGAGLGSGVGAEGLARLEQAARAGRLSRVELPMLDVTWRDGSARRLSGFLFGAAGFAAGTRLAYSHVHAAGINNGAAVAFSIAGMLAKVLFGSDRNALLAGEPLELSVDGGPVRGGSHFVTLATTLDRLMLGLRPFWGEGSGPLRWLDIAAPPRRLMAALLPVLRGRPRPWMAEAGYASGRADALDLDFAQPFVVDGELYDPGAAGIRLTAERRIGIVAP
ncbi:diacylglycerol kinase family protein [Arenibaculum pallidiluteum]|uniref:diacylglycerol kinase family protein n=1 Tax=Arenibaculum pallidiluteum TaxID=2812559 RepID=UPI001A9772E8|nr:diacylglycerol kinase family protein [Arenibaculum pallidiluteum]